MRAAVRLLPLMLLAACSTSRPVPTVVPLTGGFTPDQQVPDYAKRPFEPFSRASAVAIAQREWRAFGSLVDDSPPGGPQLPLELRPDRQPGLWQRVGDYWWSGQDFGAKEAGWTSLYNAEGTPFSAAAPAWSAAFISYVMRMAGAGTQFPYTPLHADYINAAARGEGALRAERLDAYAPQLGDLICFGRLSARGLRFEDLPAPRFFGHCDMVVAVAPGQLTVIGGNVSAGVTMKHVPTTTQVTMAGPDGVVLDGRFPWFVALAVRYSM